MSLDTICRYGTDIGDDVIRCARRADWLLSRAWGLWASTPLCDTHLGVVRAMLGSSTSWVEPMQGASEAAGG